MNFGNDYLFAILLITATSFDTVSPQFGRCLFGLKGEVIQECLMRWMTESGLLDELEQQALPQVVTLDRVCRIKDASVKCIKRSLDCINEEEEEKLNQMMKRHSLDCSAEDRSEEAFAITCRLSYEHITAYQDCTDKRFMKYIQDLKSPMDMVITAMKNICSLFRIYSDCAKNQNCLRLKPGVEGLINEYLESTYGCEQAVKNEL